MGRNRTHERKVRGFGEVPRLERAARWSVWRVRGVGYRRFARLVDETDGELVELFSAPEVERTRIANAAGIDGKVNERLQKSLESVEPETAFAGELAELPERTKLYHLGEPGYPERLLDLEEPPVFVYVRGSVEWLSMIRTVAMVGSRDATVAQGRLARSTASELAEAGIGVISGGARGIDASSHRGCLDAGFQTVSVLAGGLDRPTPRQNAPLFAEIIENGALLSEYPLGVRPRRYHYHRRNDLIAALGDATLVVRAGEKSGTLITARSAQKLGRPLCVFPGGLDEPVVAGCHRLLVEGAQCVRHARDVLEYGLRIEDTVPPEEQRPLFVAASSVESSGESVEPEQGGSNPPRTPPLDLSDTASNVYEAMVEIASEARDGCAHRDRLERRLEWPTGRLDRAILELELAGAISKKAGANAFEIPGM